MGLIWPRISLLNATDLSGIHTLYYLGSGGVTALNRAVKLAILYPKYGNSEMLGSYDW